MKNVLKKGISILSVIAIILTMLPAAFTAFAAETKVQIENADALATKKDITIGEGYTVRAEDYWCMIHTADSMRAVYCMEPGKSVASGDMFNEDAANNIYSK